MEHGGDVLPRHPVLGLRDHQLKVFNLEELIVLEVVLEGVDNGLDGLGAGLPLGGEEVPEVGLDVEERLVQQVDDGLLPDHLVGSRRRRVK